MTNITKTRGNSFDFLVTGNWCSSECPHSDTLRKPTNNCNLGF